MTTTVEGFEMILRKKGDKIRVTFNNPKEIGSVDYVEVNPTSCWSSTFNSWGKVSSAPVIELGGVSYRVSLEPIT